MQRDLATFLAQLYADGLAHDAAEPNRVRRRRNLEPASANLLGLIVRMAEARQVVEIGTANGYSTIWLAEAVRDNDGKVVSIDLGGTDEARANLHRADALVPGLVNRVEFHREDGGAYLTGLADASVDLLFLDAERVEYASWWPHPARVIRPGGILVIDNVLSHPEEIAPFQALVAADPTLTGATVPVGKGLQLVWKSRERKEEKGER